VKPKNALASAFKALGDPTRLRAFVMLRASCGPAGCTPDSDFAKRTLTDLARHLGVGLPTVSHHLKELRQAGLIRCERQGRRVRCSMNEALLRQLGLFLMDNGARSKANKKRDARERGSDHA